MSTDNQYVIPTSIWNCWELTEPYPAHLTSSSLQCGPEPASMTSIPSEAVEKNDERIFTMDWSAFVDQVISEEQQKDHYDDDHQSQQSVVLSIQSHKRFLTNRNLTFYLTIMENKEDSMLTSLKNYSFIVVGPSGSKYPVSKCSRQGKDRVVCQFRPLEPGSYVINGLFQDVIHMQGSPCRIEVTRNFKTISRPTATVNMIFQSLSPFGICCNTTTNELLVADRRKQNMIVFESNGCFNYRQGQFFRSTTMAYDATRDRILVSGKDNHQIEIFNAKDGEFQTSFGSRGSKPGQLLFPWGVAISQDGTMIAVADSANNRIQLFTSEGIFIRQFRMSSGYRKLVFPRRIAFNPDGSALYVTDFNHPTVFKLDINLMSCIRIVEYGSIDGPSGLTVDDVGNILVCDSVNSTVQIVDACGQLIKTIDTVGTSDLDCPMDITLMKGGSFAVLHRSGYVNIF